MVIGLKSGTQSVARAVSLLKAFTEARPEQRLADLARAARLHRATAHRLLATLEHEGMVARDASGELWRLGAEAIALGARAVRSSDLRAASRTALDALAVSSGETATLEVPAGADMLILDEVPGRARLGAAPSIGTRWPAHATSTGKALLAALPAAERDAMLPRKLERFNARTIASRPALLAELVRVRRRGWATANQELELGYVAVGAAVLDQRSRPIAAISIGGLALRLPVARLAALGPQVRDAAAAVSAALGYQESA
jgi:IclR family acetate operon transcriptional repressor